MVLDTDTYNEIDDQFAVVHALLSPEHLNVEALYAAPFHNNRSNDAEDGMEKSYEEILRLLDFLNVPADGFVYHGSKAFLSDTETPVPSDAATDMVERAMTATTEEPLYVVAVGGNNECRLCYLDRTRNHQTHCRYLAWWQSVVLGPTPESSTLCKTFRARKWFWTAVCHSFGSLHAGSSHIYTRQWLKWERYVQGRGRVGDYLVQIFKDYSSDHFAWSKVIWDISATAYLVNPAWVSRQKLSIVLS